MKSIRKIVALTASVILAAPFVSPDSGLFANRAQAAVQADSSTSESVGSRPATQSFALMIKGKNVTRKAQLKQGNGYSLYVAGGYTFSPAKNKLYLTDYPAYQAQIEPLPAGFDIDKLRKQGQTELKKYGKVNSYANDQLFESPMASADLFLQTSGTKGIHNYIVWTSAKGDSYLLRIHVPESGFAGTFNLIASTSLSTLLRN